MLLDIPDVWKVLLLMGIGVFIKHESVRYMEIMKKLAEEQKLYLIIAVLITFMEQIINFATVI